MTLLNAAALGALGLAVPLILLYLLKMKRQERVIPSSLLWAAVIQDLQATHPFQKLRRNLLLFLQLLMLAALALAMARPAISTSRPEGRSIAIILDGSASMKARDGGGGRTRIEEARRQARELVDALDDSAEAMVIRAAHRTSVRIGLGGDRVVLRDAIEGTPADDTAADLGQALSLASAALRGKSRPEIYLFSDGSRAMLEAPPPDLPIRFVRIGSSAANAGIIMLDVRPAGAAKTAELRRKGELEPGIGLFDVFAGLKNFGDAPVKGFLSLFFEERLAGAREITLEPGGETSLVFSERFPAGLARLSLDVEDLLPDDNSVSFMLRPPQETRIAIYRPTSPFLERAFRSFPNVDVTVADASLLKTKGFDLVVSDGQVPDPLPAVPFAVFRPKSPMPDLPLAGPAAFPDITDWTREHPLLRAVDFADVHVAESMTIGEAATGRVLLKGPAGAPIAIVQERPGLPFRVIFGFAIGDTDWPLRPSFPIFAWNLVQMATESGTLVSRSHVQTGALVALPAMGSDARITPPSGPAVTVKSDPADPAPVFNGSTEAGVYTVEWGEQRRLRFAANLLDERESDIRPAKELATKSGSIEARAGVRTLHRELWSWLALAVLLVSLFEWYAFHRSLGS